MAERLQDVKGCSKEDLDDKLKTLPKSFTKSYAEIFKHSSRPNDLMRLLQWLAFSKRAMTVNEIAEIVAVDLNRINGPFYDPLRRCVKSEDVLGICDGLAIEVNGAISF